MSDKRERDLQSLIDKRDIQRIVKESVKEIEFTSKNRWQYIISGILAFLTSILIAWNYATVTIFNDVVDVFIDVGLALVAMILGSYSIFQALMNENMVLTIIKTDVNLLKNANKTFVNLVILYISSILGNILLSIVLKIIPSDFLLWNNVLLSNLIAAFLLFFYMMYHFLIIIEIIIFAINLYRMFCVYNTLHALEAFTKDQENE